MPLEKKGIAGPFQGIYSASPRPYTPVNSWDNLVNMWTWRGHLLTRPRLNPWTVSPDGSNITNAIPFHDILGFLHNLVLTQTNAYFMTPGPLWNTALSLQAWNGATTYAAGDLVSFNGVNYTSLVSTTGNQPDVSPTQWNVVSTGGAGSTGLSYGYEVAGGRVYYANGSFPGVYADGEQTIKSMFHPGSFRYVTTLANHLVTAYTTEPAPGVRNSTLYPQRVRWCDVGNPTQWQETANTSAGHYDLLDVSDSISGLATLGRSAYIFRTNGITMMTPTGIGQQPFQFDQITHAPKGVGCFYPQALDVFGGIAAFPSEDEAYTFDGSTFTPIGGTARDLIYADIGQTQSAQILGNIVVRFNTRFQFLSYWLSMPSSLTGPPVTWIYNWESKGWMKFTSTVGSGRLFWAGNLVM